MATARHQESGVYAVRELRGKGEARKYLERFIKYPASMKRLAELAAESRRARRPAGPPAKAPHTTGPALLEEVATLIADEKAMVCEQLDLTNAPTVFDDKQDQPATVPPASGPAPKKKLTWIEFKVVDDATGQPYNTVRLTIKTPDGNEDFYTTNSEGIVRIDDIDDGTCDARCELKDPRLPDTLAFVRMGEQAVDKDPTGDRPVGARTLRIALVEAHKVKAKESLDSLAKSAGLTWQKLAKFNWDTDVPKEINSHLHSDVGCTKKTQDGYNYVFDDADNPGIVYIPSKWESTGLATGKQHVLRVRQLAPKTEKHVWIEVHSIFGLYESEPYTLQAGDKTLTGNTTDKGVIEAVVPADATSGTLEIGGKTYAIEFRDEELGDGLLAAQVRLNNLGYNCGSPDGIWGPGSQAAMRLFQMRFGLPLTGEADEETLARLTREHDLKDNPAAESLPKEGVEIPEAVVAEEAEFSGQPEDDPSYFG